MIDRFKHARVNNEMIAGISPCLLVQEQESLEAYRTKLRTTMWASKVELALAAQILQISFVVIINGVKQQIGDMPPKHAIVCRKKHFPFSTGSRFCVRKGAYKCIGRE